MADPLSFEALASSEHVLSSAENFVLYVLLEAIARGAGGQGGGSRLPLNLGVVIDRSGSMYEERRLEFVTEAVKFLADNLTSDDKVSVVVFADRAKVLITPEAARDKSAVKRAIDDIDLLDIGGGTQMALGMKAALDEVKKSLNPDRLNRVLVLTDGQTYEESIWWTKTAARFLSRPWGSGSSSTRSSCSASRRTPTANIISSATPRRFPAFSKTSSRACDRSACATGESS
jgi:Mg-chelatase subunit ChlD